jgi:hypothetical protein
VQVVLLSILMMPMVATSERYRLDSWTVLGDPVGINRF